MHGKKESHYLTKRKIQQNPLARFYFTFFLLSSSKAKVVAMASQPNPTTTATSASPSIPITEQFWSLLDKADRRFSRVRDLPVFGRNRGDAELTKAFGIYTSLWRNQQEHRQQLVDAGLHRWEVGEIASRIAQLYYGQYQRIADAAYLAEAFVFYEAVLERDYFGSGHLGTGNEGDVVVLMNKQLRFLARFLVVALVIGRTEMVARLVSQLRGVLQECKRTFQESEYKEWKHVVQEIKRFLKVDTPFMNMRPLRYSFAFDPPPDKLPIVATSEKKRGLILNDAILCSYHQNEVKFTDLTIDSFRMLQCLEWEPCGSFALNNGAYGTQAESGTSRSSLLQDLRDAALPSNPLKTILYRPAATHFLTVLATKCEELPSNGILLIYISATREAGPSGPFQDTSEKILSFRKLDMSSQTTYLSSSPSKPPPKQDNEPRLWLGSCGVDGSNYLYPCDLIPFTRRPLFVVIDSNNSYAFKSIHEAEKGETAAMLLSPRSRTPTVGSVESARGHNGSQFSMFLTAPLQAFCLLIGNTDIDTDKDAYNKAEKALSLSLNEWAATLITSSALHPVWIEVLGDPLLRRLLLRFIFCRAILALFKPTNHQEEFLPTCLPPLPGCVDEDSILSQYCVSRLATFFCATNQFSFTEAAVSPDFDIDGAVLMNSADVQEADDPIIIKASVIEKSQFSSGDGS